jgi:SAM-dependent methyltransferase
MSSIDDKTIRDFDEQWTHYGDIEGWYGSLELFSDILSPVMQVQDFKNKRVLEVGAGTGRIVGMMLEAGASHVYAVEPGPTSFSRLNENIASMARSEDVTTINEKGSDWTVGEPLDITISVGVIEFIHEPAQTISRCFEALKPGGDIFLWMCAYEGNEMYVRFVQPLRKITTVIPHFMLVGLVYLLYAALCAYYVIGQVLPLPMMDYLNRVWWPFTPKKRRLVIYDQLNPAYFKYYKKQEVIDLLTTAGFRDIEIHHRHGYSWSARGRKH